MSRQGKPSPGATASADGRERLEGVEGNARLTGATGVLLTALLLVEGLTILQIRQLITVHIVVGLLLLAPIALKIGTTTYRFARYYLGSATYVRRGPPPLLLRVLAPVLVLATVVMMASGLALLTRSPDDAGPFLPVHKASFIAWAALMVVHFLGHIIDSVRLIMRDWRPARGRASEGRGVRRGVLVVTLLVGVAVAAAVAPGNSWSGAAPRQRAPRRALTPGVYLPRSEAAPPGAGSGSAPAGPVRPSSPVPRCR